jgi:hypothetical protein
VSIPLVHRLQEKYNSKIRSTLIKYETPGSCPCQKRNYRSDSDATQAHSPYSLYMYEKHLSTLSYTGVGRGRRPASESFAGCPYFRRRPPVLMIFARTEGFYTAGLPRARRDITPPATKCESDRRLLARPQTYSQWLPERSMFRSLSAGTSMPASLPPLVG